MPENAIQVTLEIDIKALQSGLQQGKSQVEQQTKEMAQAFEELSKNSKSALEDVEKASKLAGLKISDEMKGALEQVPKLAKGIADVFSGGSILGFVGVLLDAGIALKALYEDVILLKGAKEEWAEINKKLSEREEDLDAKIRRNTIEHIRLTQGEAAAAHAALEMADKDIVDLGKDVDQLLSGKKAGKLSEGLRNDLEGLKHFDFGDLPNKITKVNEAISRAEENIRKTQAELEEAAKHTADEGADVTTGHLSLRLEQARGEIAILQRLLHDLEQAKDQHEGSKGNQGDHTKQLYAEEAERKRREREAALQKDIALKNARIDAAKQVSDALIRQDEEEVHSLLQHHTLSAEAELALQADLAEKKYRADEDSLQAKLKQLRRDPTQNAQQIVALQAQIEALQIEHNTQLLRIDEDYRQRLEKDAKQALRDEIKAVEDRAAAARAGSAERVRIFEDELRKLQAENKAGTEEYKRLEREQAKAVRDLEKEEEAARQERRKGEQQHEQAMRDHLRSELDFEHQIGKLSEGEYEARLKRQIDLAFDADKKQIEIDRDRYAKGTKDYEKYQADLTKLTDKHNADIEKLEQKSYLRRRQQFDQYFKQISSGFNNALNSWMQGTESASQAFGKMFQDILNQLVNFVEQWIEHKIEMWLMDKFISQGTQSSAAMSEIASNAAVAYSGAYAATAAIPFVGPELAPEAAMLAYMDVMAMTPAGFALGGLVPATGLALVHQGERVLPASMSGNGDLGMGSVHVHLNVNAIDSDSFQHTIKRHGNMIGNEVLRVLKKRGMATR